MTLGLFYVSQCIHNSIGFSIVKQMSYPPTPHVWAVDFTYIEKQWTSVGRGTSQDDAVS